MSLLFDPAGNLYVGDCSSSSSYIHRIDPGGMMTTYAGAGPTNYSGDGGPAAAADLWCPVGMAFGPDGALYFADDSNRIRRIDTSGIITSVVGSGAAGVNLGSFSGDGGPATAATLNDPWGIAFDRKGNLYIGERLNRRVRRVDPSGVITTVAGTGENASSGDGGPATKAGICPLGVGIDASDRLLIFDSCSSQIRRVDGRGAIGTVASTGSAGFSGDATPAPGGAVDVTGHIAVDAQGNAFFAIGRLIDRVDGTTGETTVVDPAHVPALVYASDLSAPIRQIYGMAGDHQGNLYISDGLAVSRIDPQGVLTDFAGKR
jgi:sugar lactone lactonase YvrE